MKDISFLIHVNEDYEFLNPCTIKYGKEFQKYELKGSNNVDLGNKLHVHMLIF